MRVWILGRNPKIRVLQINGSYMDLLRCEIVADKVVIIKNKEEIPYDSEGLFQLAIRKLKNRIALKRKPVLLHVKGKSTFTKTTGVQETIEGITNTDRRNFVYRSLAYALLKVKPISMLQFIILALIGCANIVLILILASGPSF